jgi:hypothetical protein
MFHYALVQWMFHEWLRKSENHRLYRVYPGGAPDTPSPGASLWQRLGNLLRALNNRLKRRESHTTVDSTVNSTGK